MVICNVNNILYDEILLRSQQKPATHLLITSGDVMTPLEVLLMTGSCGSPCNKEHAVDCSIANLYKEHHDDWVHTLTWQYA